MALEHRFLRMFELPMYTAFHRFLYRSDTSKIPSINNLKVLGATLRTSKSELGKLVETSVQQSRRWEVYKVAVQDTLQQGFLLLIVSIWLVLFTCSAWPTNFSKVERYLLDYTWGYTVKFGKG